jgi:hypothetical protein
VLWAAICGWLRLGYDGASERRASQVIDQSGTHVGRFVGLLPAGLLVISLVLVGAGPALAHGEEGEEEPVDLVEQALAIVVNSPDAMSEAQEKIEAALTADPADLEALDLEALERALVAVEAGDAHAAEDALIEALGRDPHPEEVVEGPAAAGGGTVTTVAPATAPGTLEPAEETDPTDEPEEDKDDDENGLFSTPSLDHGLTERVEGGFRSPDVAALALAVILAVAGTVLLRRREQV